MPGPLVEGHARYESECSSCHQAFKASAQRQLCLGCHEKVADDLASGEGFHSRHPVASTGQCSSCHADHKGRDADISGLSGATFDHGQTDYPLLGAHQSTVCSECHLPDVARRDAPVECFACHEKDDSHNGSLSEDCGKCHDEVKWTQTRFDHNETKYPLTGAHQSASCVGCHVGAQYKDTPTECISCHAIDDAHNGRFGRLCGDCHTTKSWKQEGFDHFKKSGFALRGAHASTACVTCHRQPPGKRKLPENCAGCHSSEDIHAGRFGAKCGDCHKPEKWAKVRFDHAERTKFALRGAHGKASCESCHSGPVETAQMKSECIDCHASDDVHRTNLGAECGECHNQDSFSGRIRFDHGLTKFPLLGLHAIAPCESCHVDHTFQRDDVSCFSCHRADDRHERTLGTKCEKCHNPNSWDVWRFDHGERTEFPLLGAHENLECSACHRKPMTFGVQMVQNCVDCHSSDDAHRGGFGRDCKGCHTSKAWKPATLGRRR
jgi:Cytochrome c7 and related cytochrome c